MTVLPPELPLIAGVSATGTAEAVDLAAEAARGGATHLMVLPPHMVTPSRNQLADFYRDVAAVGLPVMVQDAPGNSRVTMPPDLIVELAEIEGVTSVKVESPPTAPKIAALAAAVPTGFDVLGGQNALFLLEEIGGGSVGTMPACEFTDLLVEAVATFRAGQAALARARFNRLLPLIRFGLQPGLAWAVHKEVLVRRGLIDCATVRPPAQPVDERTRGWLEDVLADLGLTRETADMPGHAVLVVGASSPIGRAIARRFAADGDRVAGVSLEPLAERSLRSPGTWRSTARPPRGAKRPCRPPWNCSAGCTSWCSRRP